MSEPKSITQNKPSRVQQDRVVSIAGVPTRIVSKEQAHAKIDKFTAPKRGASKKYTLANGYEVSVTHRGVNRDRNEFIVDTYKNGERRDGVYYAQYLANGGYAGPYSSVASSKEEAFDNVKKWMKGLIR